MVAVGVAEHDAGCFWLTPKGAMMALKPGEHLDREDFPARTSAVQNS